MSELIAPPLSRSDLIKAIDRPMVDTMDLSWRKQPAAGEYAVAHDAGALPDWGHLDEFIEKIPSHRARM